MPWWQHYQTANSSLFNSPCLAFLGLACFGHIALGVPYRPLFITYFGADLPQLTRGYWGRSNVVSIYSLICMLSVWCFIRSRVVARSLKLAEEDRPIAGANSWSVKSPFNNWPNLISVPGLPYSFFGHWSAEYSAEETNSQSKSPRQPDELYGVIVFHVKITVRRHGQGMSVWRCHVTLASQWPAVLYCARITPSLELH